MYIQEISGCIKTYSVTQSTYRLFSWITGCWVLPHRLYVHNMDSESCAGFHDKSFNLNWLRDTFWKSVARSSLDWWSPGTIFDVYECEPWIIADVLRLKLFNIPWSFLKIMTRVVLQMLKLPQRFIMWSTCVLFLSWTVVKECVIQGWRRALEVETLCHGSSGRVSTSSSEVPVFEC